MAELPIPEVVGDGFVLREPDQGRFTASGMPAQQRQIRVALGLHRPRVGLCGDRGLRQDRRGQSVGGMRGATGEGHPGILPPANVTPFAANYVGDNAYPINKGPDVRGEVSRLRKGTVKGID